VPSEISGPVLADAETLLALGDSAKRVEVSDFGATYCLSWRFDGSNSLSWSFSEPSKIAWIEHSSACAFAFNNISSVDNTAGVFRKFQTPFMAFGCQCDFFIPKDSLLYGFGQNGCHCLMFIRPIPDFLLEN